MFKGKFKMRSLEIGLDRFDIQNSIAPNKLPTRPTSKKVIEEKTLAISEAQNVNPIDEIIPSGRNSQKVTIQLPVSNHFFIPNVIIF